MARIGSYQKRKAITPRIWCCKKTWCILIKVELPHSLTATVSYNLRTKINRPKTRIFRVRDCQYRLPCWWPQLKDNNKNCYHPRIPPHKKSEKRVQITILSITKIRWHHISKSIWINTVSNTLDLSWMSHKVLSSMVKRKIWLLRIRCRL